MGFDGFNRFCWWRNRRRVGSTPHVRWFNPRNHHVCLFNQDELPQLLMPMPNNFITPAWITMWPMKNLILSHYTGWLLRIPAMRVLQESPVTTAEQLPTIIHQPGYVEWLVRAVFKTLCRPSIVIGQFDFPLLWESPIYWIVYCQLLIFQPSIISSSYSHILRLSSHFQNWTSTNRVEQWL